MPPGHSLLINSLLKDRGQGLNNAITDVAELLRHLQNMKEQTLEELRKAILAYEKDLWPRGREAVLDSNKNTNVVHDWSTLTQSPLFTGGMAKEADAVKADEAEAVEAN
jgi:2-polyprenyl-6-methoxyphenol hydroxylase-like FAD-dependent oxidoreductase